ncbi:MAG: SDR family NAD(P)-dependent oxidoreductase, partial [Pseudomonadota bacterium]|nr:SDR family NAD(P)-dependent oxidoreductase [Pseudomonadota bacterium]
MNLELEGKVAVITGGSDGIGKAAALSLSQEGAHVAIAARDQGRLDDAVSEISTQTGNSVIGISTDVRDESSVVSLIAQVTDKWDGLDILVNNAGTSSTS